MPLVSKCQVEFPQPPPVEVVPLGATAVKVTLPVPVPPAPVHVRVKVVVDWTAPVEALPLVPFVPVHPPDATQLVALEDDHVSVAAPPAATVVGETETETDGTGIVPVPPPPVPPPPPPPVGWIIIASALVGNKDAPTAK